MKVLFVTSFNYLPQRTGGSESSTNDLCNALMKKGIEAGVMCSLGMYDSIWVANRIAAKLSGNMFVSDRLCQYLVFRGHNLKQGIPEVVNKFRPDIVVVQAGSPFEMVNCFSKMEIPVVLYARDVAFQRNTEPLQNNRYVGFIANSRFTAQQLSKLLGVYPLVLPPLVDPARYKVRSTRKVVLHVGLVREKGIEIAFELAKRRPDIPFQFVESWPISKGEFAAYKNRARALRNVTIHRRISDMKKFYRVTRVLLVPSILEEAWGRVVTEIQLSGIPVITSDRGGLPESVGSGGLIVQHDAGLDEWERALSLLWDMPDAYEGLSEAALERSKYQDISSEVIINQFIAYLEAHISSTL